MLKLGKYGIGDGTLAPTVPYVINGLSYTFINLYHFYLDGVIFVNLR